MFEGIREAAVHHIADAYGGLQVAEAGETGVAGMDDPEIAALIYEIFYFRTADTIERWVRQKNPRW